jgi:hypothetical protein
MFRECLQAQKPFSVDVFRSNEKKHAFFFGVCEKIVARKPSITYEYRHPLVFMPVDKVADSTEFVFLAPGLYFAVKIPFAKQIVQSGGVYHVKSS